MPVSDILQRLQKRAQVVPPPSNKVPERTSSIPPPTRSTSTTERVMDPVVARLKAARRRENEAKMKQKMDKKGVSAKKPPAKNPRATRAPSSSRPGSAQPRSGAKGPSKQPAKPSTMSQRQNAAPKKPKMSFNELMKKASSIDHSKMSINIKPKVKSPDPQGARNRSEGLAKNRSEGVVKRPSPMQSDGRMKSKADKNQAPRPAAKKLPIAKAPIPLRKPSEGLEQRLKSTRESQHAESESDDMSSFIESDDDESAYANQDYDRDEIWSIFNKGRKRSYYNHADDDSDDMEATGAEIFEEEIRSKRNALEEDRREMEEEARLAALKKARRR